MILKFIEIQKNKEHNTESDFKLQNGTNTVESILADLSTLKIENAQFKAQIEAYSALIEFIQEKTDFSRKSALKKGKKTRCRTVTFKSVLDNDESLDADLRERIEHNLKYKDDTIFATLEIF